MCPIYQKIYLYVDSELFDKYQAGPPTDLSLLTYTGLCLT